jgi:hypothetical protein
MMDGKTPETCWASNKRQDNKLENCCIWLVIYLVAPTSFGMKNTILRQHAIWTLLKSQLLKCVKIHWCGLVHTYAATPPNKPRQCILTHFNNSNFKQGSNSVLPEDGVFHTETCRSLLTSILMQIIIVFKTIQLCISWWKNVDNNISLYNNQSYL